MAHPLVRAWQRTVETQKRDRQDRRPRCGLCGKAINSLLPVSARNAHETTARPLCRECDAKLG